MKVIYFADLGGDIEEEGEVVRSWLKNCAGMKNIKFIATHDPPYNETYDVLVFDYGGIQVGNSLLEMFSRDIIVKHAEDYPSRIIVINSDMSNWAVEDAIERIGKEFPNIFFSLKEAKEAMIDLYKEKVG